MQHVVKTVIRRNAFSRLKRLLLAMITDDQHPVRAVKAVQTITVVRQCEAGTEARPSRLPALCYGAEGYSHLIDWEAEVVTQPPLLSSLSGKELERSSKLH